MRGVCLNAWGGTTPHVVGYISVNLLTGPEGFEAGSPGLTAGTPGVVAEQTSRPWRGRTGAEWISRRPPTEGGMPIFNLRTAAATAPSCEGLPAGRMKELTVSLQAFLRHCARSRATVENVRPLADFTPSAPARRPPLPPQGALGSAHLFQDPTRYFVSKSSDPGHPKGRYWMPAISNRTHKRPRR